MDKNKSPGPDGLPIEFYITFWDDVKDILIHGYEESYDDEELSETQKKSVMSLLYKKLSRELFKNYRPLTLSNTDYKIIAFVLSKRLQSVIKKIISIEQTSYIKGRFIGENVRTLLDIIEYCDKMDDPGILLFLDFQKAFDSLDWNFIDACLNKFGFHKDFIRWFKTLYKNPVTYIKVNNFLSKGVSINRGIKQGCPLSALIFIICTEMLCIAIKHDNTITGIPLPNNQEIRISQYADDTCLFLKSAQSINNALECVNKFSLVSGLHLNLDKTEGLTIGSMKRQIPNVDPRIKWPQEPIRYLGIYIGYNEKECHKMNWINKVEAMQKLIDCWRKRKLTIYGKITVIKSLVIPKIVYSASMLPIPPGIIKEIEKMLYNYIWGPRDKIKRLSIINKKELFGLGMLDIQSHFQSLKAAWFKRLYGEKAPLNIIPNYLINKLGGITLCSNFTFTTLEQIPVLNTLPAFWKEVMHSFAKAHKPCVIYTKEELYQQLLWGNRLFMVNDRVLYNKSFIDAGLLRVGDILQNNGHINEEIYMMLQNKHHYHRVLTLITKALREYRILRFSNEHVHYQNIHTFTLYLEGTETKSKYFYQILVKEKAKPLKILKTWDEIFQQEIEWDTVYHDKIKNQPEMKLSEFNYKIISGILATNYMLHKWRHSEHEHCIYCTEPKHTSIHLVYDCTHAQSIWRKVGNQFSHQLNLKNIITGNELTKTENHVITIICYVIYKKFIVEREKQIHEHAEIVPYVLTELKSIRERYSHISSKHTLVATLSVVIDVIAA